MSIALWLVPLGLVFAAVSAWASWDARRKLLARLRSEWGHPRTRPRDMEGVADLFRSDEAGAALDDRTWDDLLMDDVFAFVDRTESSIGQQILYDRLRRSSLPRAFDAFESLVGRATSDARVREDAQLALARLSDPSGHYLHRLARPDALIRRWWHVGIPLWTAAVLLALVLGFVWHGLFVLAIVGFIVNFLIRIATGRRVGGEIVWFRQVGPLLASAQALSMFDGAATAAITGAMQPALLKLRRLGAIARWLNRGPASGMRIDLLGALLEYINIQLLMDANALYFASHELQSRAPELRGLIQIVGEIDAAIAVASVRVGTDGWTRPRFVAADAPAMLRELRHPLVDPAVPNSIVLSPPHGVLVTGSNMSGKSTFLRTVGVNVVLAQTINTCLAREYAAPVYQVRSCIGRADDLIAGKSYYLVEVESVLALVGASDRSEPHLFIFDELFRGTNAVERIAAGEAVLRTLIGNSKRHAVIAATHDSELVDLLRDVYAVYHLSDAIGPNGLTFDYHLTPGPATSRNAIALLQLNGAPESLVAQALQRAAALDQTRSPQRS